MCIGNSLSSVTKLCSGLVQGNVLGPLYLYYFSTIFFKYSVTTNVHVNYADDSKLYYAPIKIVATYKIN